MVKEGFKIGVARFVMETTTFSSRSTGIEQWEHKGSPIRGEKVLKANNYIKGFLKRSREVSDTELVGAYSPRRPAGGSAGSWVTKKAFEKYATGIVEDLASIEGLDGVYLSLHGAMAVDGVDRPEAELVSRVREAIGELPIYVTLDLHSNVDYKLAEVADAILIVKRYPHYDSHRQGERAAHLLHRQLRGTYRPTMATRKPPIITPSVFQATGDTPAMEIMERARRWEDRKEDVFVSVAFGFAYADVPTVGATVMVVANNDQKLAEDIAEDMSEYIWEKREKFYDKNLLEPEEGVHKAIEMAREGETPIVLADHADRLGNSTHLLAELIDQSASKFAVATINDKEALDNIRSRAEEGDHIAIKVGDKTGQYSGKPVEIDGEVEYLGSYKEFDTLAVIKFGDKNRVLVTPRRHQVTSPKIFYDLEIDLEKEVNIVVLKSRVHFQKGFIETGIAEEAIVVEAPGLGPADLTKLEYENVPEELYPLEKELTQD